MFRLRKQIHGNPVGISLAIANHQYFTGTGDHIQTYRTKHHTLGGGYIDIAGTDNFIHLGYSLGTIGQRGNGLSTADGKYLINTGNRGGSQNHRAQLSIRRGHHHNYLANTGNSSGDTVHQD